jgi:hypothetical protein
MGGGIREDGVDNPMKSGAAEFTISYIGSAK